MGKYITADEIGFLPGRFQAYWNQLDTTAQDQLITEAEARVDEITGQSGGLGVQTGKVATIFCTRSRDTLFVPNKPVTTVTSITVLPPFGVLYPLPLIHPQSGLPLYYTWRGQGIKYRGDPAIPLPSLYRFRDPAAFQAEDTITITYDCGFATIPVNVKKAVRLIIMTEMFGESDNPGGAYHMAQMGTMTAFGGSRAEMNPRIDMAEDLLRPHRIEARN